VVLLLAGCAREAPDTREVRKSAEEYFKALERRDVKEIAERSTCLTSTNSFVGARVLRIRPAQHLRMAALDSLVRSSFAAQKMTDSSWAYANEATAESLFTRVRYFSNLASLYRNAFRAVPLSSPGTVVAADSTLETREIRARFRYAGPVVGPKPVDREQLLRILRVPGGKWIVFSVFPIEEDPKPEMI
jgi:hypothetical protein